ncbi:uncharacterized protein LOC125229843 [Leguminivora glycinivorella]|uniref:uncharacterized protein LOC125229843 n=1 Tax=Leguminivora glycinivorella TaxID=1035111 RepID=UPI00200E61F7|nr:uncharacterized protein LOC125229843 [Leguminivora glycinivorella]
MIASKEDDDNHETEKVKTKKTKLKTEDVIYSFGPALFLERICAIYRFRILDGTLMPTSNLMKVYGLVIAIAIAGIFLFYFDIPDVLSKTEPLKDATEDFPAIVILIQYSTSAVMTSCLLSRSNIRIMNSLANIDSSLRLNTNEEFYRKSRRHSVKALCLVVGIHIVSSASDYFLRIEEESPIINDMLNYILNSVQDLEILVFYLMISMLNDRLKVINNDLTKILHYKDNQGKISVYTIRQKNSKNEKPLDIHGKMAVNNLRDLSLAYDTIGEACHLINSVYNYQIFMTLISAFVYIVITLWTALFYYRTQVYTGNLVPIILWCCSEMLTVAAMAFVCEMFLSTRSETKVLVNELVMEYARPTRTRAQAKAFMRLIDSWPLRVYVYDMFTVDITLMLKFISVSTTYLIVIIQISHFV